MPAVAAPSSAARAAAAGNENAAPTPRPLGAGELKNMLGQCLKLASENKITPQVSSRSTEEGVLEDGQHVLPLLVGGAAQHSTRSPPAHAAEHLGAATDRAPARAHPVSCGSRPRRRRR